MADGKPEYAEELRTDVALARRLVADQFPQWSSLPVVRVEADSTDNDMYRLVEHLAARLPKREGAAAPIDKEHAWLPRLEPHLPLAIPTPVARGLPGCDYPLPWGVVRWLEGRPLQFDRVAGDVGLARDLVAFIAALHETDATGAPAPGAHNHWRGVALRARDAHIRRRFEWLADVPDINAVATAWRKDSAAAPWDGPPVWIHGDLKDANLLEMDGRLSGVLDWSCAAAGDPANDIAVAWTLFAGEARAVFREALAVDEATWMRARAWALIEGVLGLSYY